MRITPSRAVLLLTATLLAAAAGLRASAEAAGGQSTNATPQAPAGQEKPAGQATQPPPTPDPAQPVFRTGINFIRVDAIVTDRQGNPVTTSSSRTSRSAKTASRRSPRRCAW